MAFDGLRKRLNNSSILKQDDYFPSTYIVLQFANNVHIEAVQWIIFKIESERKDGGAELLVRKQPEVPGENNEKNKITN
ncbi:hypothetical protein J6590_071453 [Homalodisca vitripennis]|nr:hypothetical protein J6590_071453 [Homalodisca vitripennis]